MADAIILFAHGSRDPEWAAPMRVLQTMVQQARPQAYVALAFLELMQPNLQTVLSNAIAQGAQSATIIPLFLAAGGHLKQDLPRLVEQAMQAHPRLKVQVLSPIGESETVLQAIADWICAAAKVGD